MCVCVCVVPSTGDHQLHFDSVGHQDPQNLLVGDVLHTETHNRALSSRDCRHTPVKLICALCVCVCVCVCERELHGGGGQVGVFMFEFPVQSESSLLSVLVERRGQSVHLTEGGAGRHLVTMETTRCCQSHWSSKPRPLSTD